MDVFGPTPFQLGQARFKMGWAALGMPRPDKYGPMNAPTIEYEYLARLAWPTLLNDLSTLVKYSL